MSDSDKLEAVSMAEIWRLLAPARAAYLERQKEADASWNVHMEGTFLGEKVKKGKGDDRTS